MAVVVVIKVAIDWESMNEVVGIGSGCDKSSGIVSVVLVKLIEEQGQICLVLLTFFDLLDGRRFWLNNSNILMSRHSSGMAALFS